MTNQDQIKFQNVLLIDDNAVSNTLHISILKDMGLTTNIVTVESGADALEYLRDKVTEEDAPDIIFLDIRMPMMDGFGFLEAFKKLPAYIFNRAKVIMLSSSLDENDRAK